MSALFDTVIKNGLCCGCGTCSVVCSKKAINIVFENGQYVPQINEKCNQCNICLSVCPFAEKQSIQDSLLGKPAKGMSRVQCLGGYSRSSEIRAQGASGGLVTSLLKYLFDNNLIDCAVAITLADGNSKVLFEPRIIRSADEIVACSGSVYYPVEFSKILNELKTDKQRVAMVGLPCAVLSWRKLAGVMPEYDHKFVYLIGLTCGHGVTAEMTDFMLNYLCSLKSGFRSIRYREKLSAKISSDYSFCVKDSQDNGKELKFTGSCYSRIWSERIFMPKCCDLCKDVFAEYADATFMDAWTPEYVADNKGTSFAVIRSVRIEKVISDMCKKDIIYSWPVSEEEIISSQQDAIQYKRYLMRIRNAVYTSDIAAIQTNDDRIAMKQFVNNLRKRNLAVRIWRSRLPRIIRTKLLLILSYLSFRKLVSNRLRLFIKQIGRIKR